MAPENASMNRAPKPMPCSTVTRSRVEISTEGLRELPSVELLLLAHILPDSVKRLRRAL